MTINLQLMKNHITFYRQLRFQISNLSIFATLEEWFISVLSIFSVVRFLAREILQIFSEFRFIDKYISQVMNFFKSNGFIGVEGKLSI